MTLLADVVAASQEVAETNARSRKVAILAELLERLDADEVAIAAGLLSGVPRQGRVGVGYSTIHSVKSPPADEPTLTVADLDTAILQIQAATGSGSGARRTELLAGLSIARPSRKPASSGACSRASCDRARWPG